MGRQRADQAGMLEVGMEQQMGCELRSLRALTAVTQGPQVSVGRVIWAVYSISVISYCMLVLPRDAKDTSSASLL